MNISRFNHNSNPFFIPIQTFHNRFICSFDHLPAKGIAKEIAIRIITVVSSLIIYPLLGIVAFIGMPFSSFFVSSSKISTVRTDNQEKAVNTHIPQKEADVVRVAVPKIKVRFNNISITCCSKRKIQLEIEDKISQPQFCSNLNAFFQDGLMKSFEKKAPSSLRFIPEGTQHISQNLRIKLAAQALLLAPNQPQNRPFEYVGYGSGYMRQDMHQILYLLSKDFLHIKDLKISLVDPIYAPDSPDYDEKSIDSLIEFAAILHLRAPDAKVAIQLYSSTEEFLQDDPQIDLLIGIRVENEPKNPDVRADLIKLSQHLSDNSGFFISDTTNQNKVQSICKHQGVQVNEAIPNKKGSELRFYTAALPFQSYKGNKVF